MKRREKKREILAKKKEIQIFAVYFWKEIDMESDVHGCEKKCFFSSKKIFFFWMLIFDRQKKIKNCCTRSVNEEEKKKIKIFSNKYIIDTNLSQDFNSHF